MKINFTSKTIEINKWEKIKAINFDCEDRKKLFAVQEAYPDFGVVIEDLPFPDMKPGKGVTYDFIECYIYLVSAPRADVKIPEMETFISMRKNGYSYSQIKSWFTKEFRFNTL